MKHRNYIDTFLKGIQLWEKYSWALGVAILVFGISVYVNYYSEIHANEAETHGVIYNVTSMRVGNFSGPVYKYKFGYLGKDYFGTSTKNHPERIKIGRIFKVKFSAKDPNKNEIFFEYEYLRKIVLDTLGRRDTLYLIKNQTP
ncbi:hypothetical protein [Flagellimonas flava]|uniref:Uncharacterized protein n=1 Tax=Flagellimonas flava TaxID=570519 RepID=A0A1M5ILS3_9FLAO|nr:hypothetical protein [Allomuricauda flava]SHG28733.1 hypothetical protein SAMN04488116_0766 [Allomuricauda flava]